MSDIKDNQSAWQLSSIQIAATGLPVMSAGWSLQVQYGFGTALISAILGTFILWLIGLVVVWGAYGEGNNIVRHIQRHLGNTMGRGAACIFVLAFVFWIPVQLQGGLEFSSLILPSHLTVFAERRLWIAFGLFIPIISLGGIRWIKHICFFSLPFMVVVIVYSLFRYGALPDVSNTWGISLICVLTTIGLTLPGVVCLPTFFRHGKSMNEALAAVPLVAVGTLLWQISGMFLPILFASATPNIYDSISSAEFIILALFVLNTVLCVNLVNIYFASAGADLLMGGSWGRKGFLLVGLSGTLIFGFLQVKTWMYTLEDLMTAYISSLLLVLITSYLIELVVRHRTRRFETVIAAFCWIVGGVAATTVRLQIGGVTHNALLAGSLVSLMSVIVWICLEEAGWSWLNRKSNLDADKNA